MLELLCLEKATVTIDAMGCQKEIVKKIVKKKAGYVIAVKYNQQALYEQVEKLFTIARPASQAIEYDNGHEKAETRKCTVISNFTFFDATKNGRGSKALQT